MCLFFLFVVIFISIIVGLIVAFLLYRDNTTFTS